MANTTWLFLKKNVALVCKKICPMCRKEFVYAMTRETFTIAAVAFLCIAAAATSTPVTFESQ
jgi:hypothetical protein